MAKYKILVSEPWNYKGTAGDNLIVGKVIKVLSPIGVIFKSDHLQNFDGTTGTLLLLKARYEKQVLNIEHNYVGTVGGGLILIDDYKAKDEKYLEANSKYVLIGSLDKMSWSEWLSYRIKKVLSNSKEG
jgi:hypothetical protein